MVKLKITLIILSIIIVFATGYTAWWLTTQSSYVWEAPLPSVNGTTGYTMLTPEHETLSNLARYSSISLPVLGILLLAANIFIKNGSGKSLPATLNIVAGALIAAAAFFITVWGYPTTFVSPDPAQTIRTSIFPGPDYERAMWSTAIILAAALAVFGIGIAQLIKSKKIPSS